jgi:hypothetical protein
VGLGWTGGHLIVGEFDGTIQVWDKDDEELCAEHRLTSGNKVWQVIDSNKYLGILSFNRDRDREGVLEIWAAETATDAKEMQADMATGSVECTKIRGDT